MPELSPEQLRLIRQLLHDAVLQDLVWLCGDERALRASPCTFCLLFGQWGDFGMPMLHVRVVAVGHFFAMTSGGVPLEIDEWEAQFAAWWEGWKAHWDAKGDRDDEGPSQYDAAIPAGEPERCNLDYRPPAKRPSR